MTDSFEYQSDNIIVGAAELPAVQTAAGTCWMIPGLGIECDHQVALRHAEEMDRLITRNLSKYKRKLFR